MIKRIVFFTLLALMLLPVFQHGTKLFHVRPLDGDFILNPRPAFSWKGWMNGSFQSQFNNYIEDHIGFRNFPVRLNNQIDFSLFSKANAEGVVVGKDNILLEYDYIRAYTGGDFIGKNTIDKKLNKVKFLQKHLKQNYDIDLVLVFEPSKARYQTESIPEHYLKNGISLSNYEYFTQQAAEKKINHLDLNRLFQTAKDTTSMLLYPKYGIHWSEGTMPFVIDTLVSYLENLRNIRMPEYGVDNVVLSDTLNSGDYDVGKTINLLWKLPHPPMPYPTFKFNNNAEGEKPMVLAVADSYYWNIFNTRVPSNIFANEAFWYFNAKVYPDFYFGEKWVKDLNLKAEIEKQDIIIISVTERFMYKFGWNFIEQVYNLYTPEYTGHIIEKYEEQIRMDAGWFDEIVLKAERDGIVLEEAIQKEAYYQAWVQEPETFLTWFGQEHYESVIRNDKKWNDAIKAKAAENKKTYEEQLTEDADYIFRQEKPQIRTKYNLIKHFSRSICADPAWLSQVTEKARGYEMDVETMLRVDAEYMANQQINPADPLEEKTKTYINLIRADASWLESVQKKAVERGISLDQMIQEDARYMAEQELKK